MSALYMFALVVGVGMYLFSLVADFAGHADVGDHAPDLDQAGDHGVEGFKILSLRNATYFLFAFGVTGVLLRWAWGGEHTLITALLATVLGVAGGTISSLAFGWVRRSESGLLPGDSGWVGLVGRVTIPLSTASTGKILVERGGREHELLARPFEPDAERPERWTSVMVIEMQQGIALVSPDEQALDNPDVLRIAPESES
jgi:hypothetical protein